MFNLQYALYEFGSKRFPFMGPGWMRYVLIFLFLVVIAVLLGEQEALAQAGAGETQGAVIDVVEEAGSQEGGGGGTR